MPGKGEDDRPRWRTLRFLAGLTSGLLVAPLLSLAGLLLIVLLVLGYDAVIGFQRHPLPESGPTPARLEIVGADVTRAGGVRLEGRAVSEGLVIHCRGRCDDLAWKMYRPPARLAVHATDGRVLTSRDETWKTWFWGVSRIDPWKVAGDPLAIRDAGAAK